MGPSLSIVVTPDPIKSENYCSFVGRQPARRAACNTFKKLENFTDNQLQSPPVQTSAIWWGEETRDSVRSKFRLNNTHAERSKL